MTPASAALKFSRSSFERGLADVAQLVDAHRRGRAGRGCGTAAADLPRSTPRTRPRRAPRRCAAAVFAGHRLAALEAGEPFAHVVGEVRLAELAVVDDVDPAGHLSRTTSATSSRSMSRSAAASYGLPSARAKTSVAQLFGPRERPGVRDEDAVGLIGHPLRFGGLLPAPWAYPSLLAGPSLQVLVTRGTTRGLVKAPCLRSPWSLRLRLSLT